MDSPYFYTTREPEHETTFQVRCAEDVCGIELELGMRGKQASRRA